MAPIQKAKMMPVIPSEKAKKPAGAERELGIAKPHPLPPEISQKNAKKAKSIGPAQKLKKVPCEIKKEK